MVVGHFKCSGTHRGEWLGVAPTGRRFADVDEDLLRRASTVRVRQRRWKRRVGAASGSAADPPTLPLWTFAAGRTCLQG
jgi:hypothetical protein